MTDDTTTVVKGESTHWHDGPIVNGSDNPDIECPDCGTVTPAQDCGKDVPIGHKKWSLYTCPECGSRLARVKGTNRAVDEDRVGESIEDVYVDEYDDDPDLIRTHEVDVDAVGDTVTYIVWFNPQNGKIARQPVDADDLTDGHYDEAGGHVFIDEWNETWPIDYDVDDDHDLDKDDSVTRFARFD